MNKLNEVRKIEIDRKCSGESYKYIEKTSSYSMKKDEFFLHYVDTIQIFICI